MSQDLVPAADIERWSAVTKVVGECSLDAIGQMEPIAQQLRMARGIAELRRVLTPQMMQDIMSLQNSALGFKTDKPDGGYSVEVVRDVAIEALLRGARMVGNEVNIIGGNFYAAKGFFVRKLREFPGLANLTRMVAPPRQAGDKGALVNCSATWTLNGVPQELPPRDIPIRVNSGMGVDAILGKAQRKLDAAIYSQITGCEWVEGDADDVRAERARNVTAEPVAEPEGTKSEQVAAKVAAAKAAKAQPTEAEVVDEKPATKNEGGEGNASLGF